MGKSYFKISADSFHITANENWTFVKYLACALVSVSSIAHWPVRYKFVTFIHIVLYRLPSKSKGGLLYKYCPKCTLYCAFCNVMKYKSYLAWQQSLLHFVAFFHVASLLSTGVENKKVGVDNEKALELTNSPVFHRGRQ